MRFSSRPELPDEWASQRKRPRDIAANTLVIAIAAVSMGFGVLSGAAGNFMALRYSLLFGVVMILVVALGATMRKQSIDLSKVTRTVDGVQPGTEIRHSAAQFVLLVALISCSAALFVLAAVETSAGNLDSVVSATALLFGAIGLILLSFPVTVGLGRVRRGGLELSHYGVSQRGWSFESRLSWSDIAGMKPAYNGHPVILLIAYTNAHWDHRYTTRIWRIDRLPPVPMIEIDCRKFDVDPAVLLSFLSAYVDTPENRTELGTPAARSRAQLPDPYR